MNTKIKWMLDNGFEKRYKTYGFGKIILYKYKDWLWTCTEIKSTPLSSIMSYKKFYDGEIDLQELYRRIGVN